MSALPVRVALSAFLLVLLAPLSLAQAPHTCGAVDVCLEIGDVNCLAPGRACPVGAYCHNNETWSSGVCGEKCSAGVDTVRCHDPNYPNAIFCNDYLSDGNGTCVFGSLFGPGESCYLDSRFDDSGGCIFGTCGADGKCSFFEAGDICTLTDASCAPGLFCNQPDGTCAVRKAAGQTCGNLVDCDYDLICTNRGHSFDAQTCQKPWQQSEGMGCSLSEDCSAGLFCGFAGQCVKPAEYHDEVCSSSTDCQHGWACKCDIKFEGDERLEIGGRCTQKTEVTNEYIERFNAMQLCLKKRSCQDYWWRAYYAFGPSITGPQQCFQDCLAQSRFADLLTDLKPVEEGKCFESTSLVGVLVPLSALLIAAVLLSMIV